MSSLYANTYDYAVAVTESDTVDDPAGPFAGLYIATTANLVCDNLNGPQSANPITLAVVAGTYIRWPVKRIRTGTTAVVFGLVSGIVRQGP